MRVSRPLRRWLSGWLIVQLLFMQLATAAYACPQLGPPLAVNAAMSELMPGCNGDMAAMDSDQPQLCKPHCQAGQQSVNSSVGAASALDAPPALAFGALWADSFESATSAASANGRPESLAAGPPAGTPPLYLLLHVLRN